MRTRITHLAPILLGLIVAAPLAAQPPVPPTKPAGLDVVPTDSFAFLTVNAGKLWDNPGFKPFREWYAAQKVGPVDELTGVPAADLERVTLFTPTGTLDPAPFLLVTTRKPYNEVKVLKALTAERTDPKGPRRTGNAVRTGHPEFPIGVLVDERTLLFVPQQHDELPFAGLLGQLIAKKIDGPLATALADAAKHDIAFAFDVRPLAALTEDFRTVAPNLAPYQALWKARTAAFTADFDKTAHGVLKLTFANEADAKRAAPVLKEAGSELTGVIEKELARDKERMDPLERAYLELYVNVLKAAKVETEGANVLAVVELPYQEGVARFVTMLPKSYPGVVKSAQAQNNLKQLALAMHDYEGTYAVLPSDLAPIGEKGAVWSWRVQILPFLEQQNLYSQLDLTKAWDDPANLKTLQAMEMPKVFEIPGRPAQKGHTYFRIFSLPKNAKGKDRPWLVEGQKGPKFVEITDGTSNTLMIVEAGEAVPWYKPDVLAYDGVLPLPQLGDKSADRFLAAMGDGKIRTLKPSKLSEKTLRALITIQGGEVIELP